jgi:hypothetical protein
MGAGGPVEQPGSIHTVEDREAAAMELLEYGANRGATTAHPSSWAAVC